jgi:hypothetical protein
LVFPCPNRHTLTIRSLKDLNAYKNVKAGDQVKVRVKMRREDLADYPALRDEVRAELDKRQWVECGFELEKLVITPKKGQIVEPGEYLTAEQRVRRYAADHDLTHEQEELGVKLLCP